MSASKVTPVVLFTDLSAFATKWSQALAAVGLPSVTALPSELPTRIEKGAPIVIDADAEVYGDDDELLAHAGLARALGAFVAVVLPANVDFSSIDDLLDDLCGGLVARRSEDIDRLVAAIARRADANRGQRFEYLTVSPRGGELLAIFSDGHAVVLPRPVLEDDDDSAIESIALEDEATRAVLALESGRALTLTATIVAQKAGHKLDGHGDGAINGAIDGVKLGARIRALRLAAGLTQAELARRTGIHRPNIARVEAGRHTPSLETLARLASAIGVPTTRVLTD